MTLKMSWYGLAVNVRQRGLPVWHSIWEEVAAAMLKQSQRLQLPDATWDQQACKRALLGPLHGDCTPPAQVARPPALQSVNICVESGGMLHSSAEVQSQDSNSAAGGCMHASFDREK